MARYSIPASATEAPTFRLQGFPQFLVFNSSFDGTYSCRQRGRHLLSINYATYLDFDNVVA